MGHIQSQEPALAAGPETPGSGPLGASFRQHLMGILAAALLPACLVAGLAIWLDIAGRRDRSQRDAEAAARSLSLAVDARLTARLGVAVALAAMASNGTEPPLLGEQLRQVAARLGSGILAFGGPPGFALLLDTSQRAGAPLPPPVPGSALAQAVAQVAASAQPAVSAAWDEAAPADTMPAGSAPASRNLAAGAFAPVFQGDDVVAVIAIDLDLPLIRQLLQRKPMRPGGRAAVIDQAGQVVATAGVVPTGARADWSRLPAEPGVTERAGPAGEETIAVAPLAQAPGWRVVVGEPLQSPEEAWRRPAPPLAAAAILGILAGAWLALLLARRCLRPVAELTRRAAAIVAGLPPHRDPPASGVREFAMLGTSLTAAHAALEHQAEAARQGRALLQSVIDGTPDALHVRGLDGRVIVANAAADRLFCALPDGLLGRRPTDLMPAGPAAQGIAHDRRTLRDGQPSTEDVDAPPPDNRRFRVTKAPLRRPADGRVIGIISLVQDVTAQRRTEAELRQAEAEMQRLGRRATAGAMASGLAHELNQPLTAATNYLRAAGRLMETDTSAERLPVLREAVRAAAEQTLRAGEIIRRLRDFFTRPDILPAPEPVAAVIEEGIRLALGAFQPPGLQLRLQVAPGLATARVDRLAVQQVLVNLLRNAVEAMQDCERRALHVSASAREEDGSRWLDLRVADTGHGVPAAVLDRLFEPFVSTKPDGMGVGLAICRRIAEGQGGTITVDAHLPLGTAFTLTLPLAAEAAPAAGAASR